MNDINTKLFTIKDIAKELNVHNATVSRKAKKLFPEKITNGKTTEFSEQERKLLLKEISASRNSLQKEIAFAPALQTGDDHHQLQENCKAEKMTILQVSEVLNVHKGTLKRIIKDIFPEKMKARKKTYLTEQEVTLIKARLVQNRHLATKDNPSRIADMPKTNLEKEIIVHQAKQILQEEGESLITNIVGKQLQIFVERFNSLEANIKENFKKQKEDLDKVLGKTKFVGDVVSSFVEDTKDSILGKALFHGADDKNSKALASYLENKKGTVYFSDRKDFQGEKNKDYFTVTEVANMLQENKFKIFDLLRKHKFIFSRSDKDSSSIYKEESDKYNCLIQAFEEFPSKKKTFFFMENVVTKNQKGIVVQETHQLYVSKRGIEFIQFLIEEEIQSVDRDSLMPNGIKFENPLFKMPFSFEELNETKPLKDFLKEYKIEDGFEKAYSFLYKDKTLDYNITVPKRMFFKILNRLRLNEYALIIFKGALALQYAKEDVEVNKAV